MAKVIAVAAVAALITSALTAGPGGSGDPPSAAETEDKANIVVFLVDDMRKDDLRWMPKTREHIVSKGMRFPQAISSHPICCPARAQMLTGQYATNNGVHHNAGERGGYKRLDPSRTIATMLDAEGYYNAWHGKYLNRYGGVSDPSSEPGWDRWDPLVHNVYDYYDFTFANGDTFTDDYVTTRIQERTLGSIRTAASKGDPFFVVSAHLAPHFAMGTSWRDTGTTYNAPPPESKHEDAYPDAVAPSVLDPAFAESGRAKRDMPGRYGKAKNQIDEATAQHWFHARIRTLQSVDTAVEETVNELKAQGVYDNTYLFFVSDNGYLLGEHSMRKKNYFYDASLRIPMVVSGPGIERGTSPFVAHLADLPWTFAGIGGVTPRERTLRPNAGNLLPILHGRVNTLRRDTTLLLSAYNYRWAYRGVRTRRYTYGMWWSNKEQDFLFDRRRQPHERVNLADRPGYQDIVRELRRRTYQLGVCDGPRYCNREFGPLPAPGS